MSRLLFALAVPLILSLALPAAAPPVPPDFDRDIAPLLASRCLDCHTGAEAKGEFDLSRRKNAAAALVGGKPDASLLWQRVRDGEMPPKKPLSDSEKSLLRAWIASGARWGADPIDPFRVTTASRAGYDWWSLRPVVRPAPPAAQGASGVRNSIDHFILAKLEANRLMPSPEADRRTLIRRLSFDLTGLPPTPEEVKAFVSDRSPDAYERVVDRLLSSPAYGERWGRHWLDIVRFGESDGFERDLPRLNAWPYRDWVIGALNDGMGYDEFVRLQLAGDVLRAGRTDGLMATGFLVAGPHDIVLPVSENMKAGMRQDELEDIVGTVGQTFLGLTVHCARCHDHKFDPVPQKDYYRLASALAGVGFGERPVPNERDRPALAQVKRRLGEVQGRVTAIEDPVRRELIEEKTRNGEGGPRPLAEWDFTLGLEDRAGKLHGKAHGTAKRDRDGLHLDGKSAYVSTPPLAKELREKTLEAWVRLDNLTQAGGGVIGVQVNNGSLFDSVVYGEQQKGRWISGSEAFRRTQSFEGVEEKEAARRIVHVAVTYASDGNVTAYRDGLPYGKPYRVEEPVSFDAGKSHVVFGLRHGTAAGGNRMLAGVLQRARLYDRALSADEIAASAGRPNIRPDQIAPRLKGGVRERYADLIAERARLDAQRARLEASLGRKLYAVNSLKAGATHVLARGVVTAKGEVVAPEVPAALPSLPATRLRPDAPEQERRLALAKWVSDPNNPLVARVMVNRLWHYHFGLGLVETTSDLGFNGGRPSHPELLDWLAAEFVSGQFSLKSMHRLLVTSATYRQSSAPRNEALAVDAENRLLWRKSPLRLEAESVRDAILAASGEIDRHMGGPSYLDFRTYFFKGTQFYDPVDQVGPAFSRRSVYRMWARGGRSPLLDTLDCPDPSTTTPRRARTTTPLQALALFNNAFVLHQADRFAERVRGEAGGESQRQVTRAYALAYGRPPSEEEMKLLRPFVERHGLEALARVIFNTSEFVQAD